MEGAHQNFNEILAFMRVFMPSTSSMNYRGRAYTTQEKMMDLITALRPEYCGLEFYFDEYTQRYAIHTVNEQWREWLGAEWYLFIRACYPYIDKRTIRVRLRTELERLGVFTSDTRLWKAIRELGQQNTVNLEGLSELARNVRGVQLMRRRKRGL